jgi:hypothetical protein
MKLQTMTRHIFDLIKSDFTEEVIQTHIKLVLQD